MRKQTRKWLKGLITITIAIVIAAFWFYPWFYVGAPIEGQVVDAGTQEPLEGVIVTANWEMARGTLGGTVPVGQLTVMETVTDPDGRFRFPGWGPKWFPKQRLSRSDAPQLIFFKPGYEYQGKVNPYTWGYLWPWRRSDWDGKTIELKPFKGSLGEYYKTNLMFLGTSAGYIIRDNCGWKKIPRMLVALHKQERLLTQKGILNSLYSIDQLSSEKCGSAQEFLKEYMK